MATSFTVCLDNSRKLRKVDIDNENQIDEVLQKSIIEKYACGKRFLISNQLPTVDVKVCLS